MALFSVKFPTYFQNNWTPVLIPKHGNYTFLVLIKTLGVYNCRYMCSFTYSHAFFVLLAFSYK